MRINKAMKKSGWIEIAFLVPVLFVFLYLQSCDVILDIVADCIDDDGPVFKQDSIPAAILNEYYETRIRAEIENEPGDDDYAYDFTFDGDMAQGMRVYLKEADRRIIIVGTPRERGNFVFSLSVSVEYKYKDDDYYDNDEEEQESYDDGNSLCTTYADKQYTLVVK